MFGNHPGQEVGAYMWRKGQHQYRKPFMDGLMQRHKPGEPEIYVVELDGSYFKVIGLSGSDFQTASEDFVQPIEG